MDAKDQIDEKHFVDERASSTRRSLVAIWGLGDDRQSRADGARPLPDAFSTGRNNPGSRLTFHIPWRV
jgi:hypothetical protein